MAQCDQKMFDVHIYTHLRTVHGFSRGGRNSENSPKLDDFAFIANPTNMRELFASYLHLKCSELFGYFSANGCHRTHLPEFTFRHTKESRSLLFEVCRPLQAGLQIHQNLVNERRIKAVHLPSIFDAVIEYNQNIRSDPWSDQDSEQDSEQDTKQHHEQENHLDDDNGYELSANQRDGTYFEHDFNAPNLPNTTGHMTGQDIGHDHNWKSYYREVNGTTYVCSTPPGSFIVQPIIQPIGIYIRIVFIHYLLA